MLLQAFQCMRLLANSRPAAFPKMRFEGFEELYLETQTGHYW